MILFHAKRDGTVTTTPNFVPQGSSMQDLVVVSEFDYAYCAIKLLPASGEYIEDIPCTPILQKDYSTIFTAPLPSKATVVAGSVDYQLIFTAADGTTQTTLAGSFTVPRGVPVSTPGSVEEMSVKTIGDLYAIMANTYGLFVGHERDIYQSLADIAALKKTVSSAGYVTIPVTQWNDGTPTIAEFTLDGFGAGMTAMLIPADSNTQTAAREARLSAYPVAFPIDSDTQTVEIIRADADKAPDIPLRFAYLILKTADAAVAPSVAIIGVDAYGEGGGTASGVDESAVRAIITAMLGNVANERQYSASYPPPYPVTSVNGKTGAVSLPIPSKASDVGADPAGTASSKLTTHNVDTASHQDLRLELQRLADRLNAALNSTDTSLDDLKEIVAYIKSNKTLIDGITSSKVNVTDIVNNLTTNTANVPLSAAQGVALKLLIDSLEEIVEGKTTAEQVAADIANALKAYQPAGDYLTTADAPAIINTEVNKVVNERKEDLQGEPGKDGYTPVAGKDYPTEEQVKTLIRTEVSAATAESFPKVSRVDQMTDTSKIYIKVNEGEEPYFWAYVTLHHPGSIEPDGFTDVLSTAIDSTGAIYNGCGYKNGWRVDSSGKETELATASVTGFIACNKGDTIYMKGIQKHITNGHAIPYKSDFTKYGNPIYNSTMTENEDGTISFVAALSVNTGYIRIVGLNPFAEDAVISVNNPIKYKVVEPYDYQEWRAIYPVSVTDHTADIIALQYTVNEHTNEIAQLKAGVSGAVDMRVWDKPIYDTAPVVLIEGNTKPAVGDRNTVQSVYDAYDALMAAHPRYITKTAYKDKTADGQTLYRYDFQAPKPHEYSGGGNPAIVKPKIILISGIHSEMAGIWSLFHALEEIVTNPALRDIRRNAHLIVVPVCNPYCISGPYAATNHRKNANGVEIHRNFAVDHVVIDSSNNNYGGAEPLSEVETQHIDSILAANPDAVAFVSCHNFDAGGGMDYGTSFMWASTATNYLYNLGGRFGVKMSEAWEDKYGDTFRANIDANKTALQPDGDYTVGMAGKSTTPGTEAKQCLLYGIQGMTFEVGGDMVALGGAAGDSVTVTRGAEVYANLIATLLAAYDTADKKACKYQG